MNLAKMRENHLSPLLGLTIIILSILAIPAYIGIQFKASAAPTVNQTSTTCYALDGAFTDCTPDPNEWGDPGLSPIRFPPEITLPAASFLYAVGRDDDPTMGVASEADTLFLMYDDVGRTTPLGTNEFVTVSFKTVEVVGGAEKLEHYTIHIFGDDSFIFIEDGVVQGPGRVNEIDDQRADAGFGTSPNSATPHVMAEFQIGLTSAGFSSYSPDPLFWSSGLQLVPDLKCYNISPPDNPTNIVTLTDQFGVETNEQVENSVELCVAAIKNNNPLSFAIDVKCYQITGHNPGTTVTLDDQFGVEDVTVGLANLLCVSVRKTQVSPTPISLGTIPKYDVDFKCYDIAGSIDPPSVTLLTQFGGEDVNPAPADRLCTPVTKSPGGTAPASPLDKLHYKCYPITGPDDPHVVSLLDQFGTETNVQIGTPSRLCTNVIKTAPPTPPPGLPHLKCYAIDGHDPGKTVDLETQFGAELNVTIRKAMRLCVTAAKNDVQPTFDIDFKCYSIYGKGPNLEVILDDLGQQFPQERVLVGDAFLLCTAVVKNPLATSQPAQIELKCYQVQGGVPPSVPPVNLTDQFHRETNVIIGPPESLCISATKTTAGTAPPNPPALQLDFKCYFISGNPPSVPPVNLRTQFGDETGVVVGPPQVFCTPVKKTPILHPPPDPNQPEGVFKCYNISPPHDPTRIVQISDQFGNETNVEVGPSFALCAFGLKTKPGQQQPLPPELAAMHLKCYSIAGHDPKEVVDLQTQFDQVRTDPLGGTTRAGETNIDVGKAFALCTWAIKNQQTPQFLPPHYKCYDILGHDPDAIVDIQTQFGNETNVEVGQAFALCTVAIKDFRPVGTETQFPELKCYRIPGHDPNAVVNLDTQFGPEPNVVVGQAFALCVPTLKTLHLGPSDTDGDGVPDTTDNCVLVSNAAQTDTGAPGLTPNGVGDACEASHATSALINEGSSFAITPHDTDPSMEPSLQNQVSMIAEDRCGPTNQTCWQDVVHDLLDSQVCTQGQTTFCITQQQANQLEQDIIEQQFPPTPTFPTPLLIAVIAAVILGTLTFYKRKRISTLTSSLFASILASFKLHRRNKHIT